MDNNEVNPSSSDDESVSDETDDVLQRGDARSIRQTGSCAAVEDETSPPTTSPLNAKYINQGNPKLGNRMQLFSRTNYFLAIYADGAVRGTLDNDDLHTHLEVSSAVGEVVGHVTIRGTSTGLYLAMAEDGSPYAAPNPGEDTVFVETITSSNYNVYLAKARGWYLGIKKNGTPKNGAKTRYGQNAVQFLPRRKEFE